MTPTRTLLLLAWSAALIAALATVTEKTAASSRARYDLLSPPALSDLDPRLIDVLTLGHRGLYEDYLSISAAQILGDEALRAQPVEAVFAAIARIVRHQPRGEGLYTLSCFVLALDFQRPELCERITIVGLKVHPESWKIPAAQGFIYARKLGDTHHAALHYSLAASRPDAPAFLRGVAKRLAEGEGLSTDDAKATVDGLFEATGDGQLKAILQRP